MASEEVQDKKAHLRPEPFRISGWLVKDPVERCRMKREGETRVENMSKNFLVRSICVRSKSCSRWLNRPDEALESKGTRGKWCVALVNTSQGRRRGRGEGKSNNFFMKRFHFRENVCCSPFATSSSSFLFFSFILSSSNPFSLGFHLESLRGRDFLPLQLARRLSLISSAADFYLESSTGQGKL